MKRIKISEQCREALIEAFVESSLAQDRAELYGEISMYNRLFKKIQAITEELKSRAGDERRFLLPLLGHNNGQVRLNATHAILAIAPEAGRESLRQIAMTAPIPHNQNAKATLRHLTSGFYKPK